MASLVPGIDTGIVSDEPLLEVRASEARPLAAGRHLFQLVVTDAAGNASAPVTFPVLVRDPRRPIAIVDAIRADGTRLYRPELVVEFGEPFQLTGERSSDRGGRISTWQWTLLAR
ncbi:hypothetical protein [Pseudoxanthomonas kaohsiungensis]|uniref:Uncharacterized protein n=1 Tax=Pseudoxanthomonas kaohsiungensis TaxID=283923 RepID=A0ABW3LV22_9GAMM|nr:hypothetical protein [Pseudoxanthomonas kaohsiungensis]KAF1704462.1 hypothetical protein CSC66_02425 [Pseudoxanthomonas kaohsiungensis]